MLNPIHLFIHPPFDPTVKSAQSLALQLSDTMHSQRVDLWGVADLSPQQREIESFLGEALPATTALVFGRKVEDPRIDHLPEQAWDFFQEFNRVLSHELNLSAAELVRTLRADGYEALALHSGSQTPAPGEVGPYFPPGLLKMAVRAAGLAWIGKSSLLITPEYGPRMCWSAVLTNAPFAGVNQPMANGCGPCELCLDACPVGALREATERAIRDPAHARQLRQRCFEGYRKSVLWPKERECCICQGVCPYGRVHA